MQTERRKLLSVCYAIASLVGLAFPALAMVFCFGIGVYLIVPFREVVQLLFRCS
jgi:hypothetical protein